MNKHLFVGDTSYPHSTQSQRADALAAAIHDLTKLVALDHETKEAFIERVKSVLSIDPDLRVSELHNRIAELEAQLVEAKKFAAPQELCKIGELLRTQDNRCTDQPMFIVQQQVEHPCDEDRHGYFESTRVVWYFTNEGVEIDGLRASRLEALYKKRYRFGFEEIPEKYGRVVMGMQYEYVTGCFTEAGAEAYLRINGHNLKQPRIYANGSFRNIEFKTVRNWLMSLPPTQEQGQ